MHMPALDAVQPDRYWLLAHRSASAILQSRSEQTPPVQSVQPAPYVLSHDVHVPTFDAVHPCRYLVEGQCKEIKLVHSRT